MITSKVNMRSAHKNTESIKSYARRLSAARKRGISQIISNNLGKQKRGNFQLLPELVFQEPKQNISPSIRLNNSSSSTTVESCENLLVPATTSMNCAENQLVQSTSNENKENQLVPVDDNEDDIDFFCNIPNNMHHNNKNIVPIPF